MSTADITSVLRNAQNADASVRTQAELQLQQFQQQNLAGYLLSLASELADESKPADVRQIAGLIVKNALDAPSEARKAQLIRAWSALDANVKSQVEQLVLSALGSPAQLARHTAALALAKIAAIELPQKQWPTLISTLLANMGMQPPNSALKQATLESLGYVCEEMGKLPQDVLEQGQVNSILTAVHQGMHKDEPDREVRRAATTAMYNALEFAQTNFENPGERDVLMMAIFDGTSSADEVIRQESFQCLVKVASGYYDKLPAYMQTIFELTRRAVVEDVEDVAKQAIEFWCTVAEEEIDLMEEQDEGDSSSINHHFVKQALRPLLALLLDQLFKQEEDQDKDDTLWNVSMAAGTCLGLIAAVVGDDVVTDVMQFVQANILQAGPENWRRREAGTFALGSILEGPSLQQLTPFAATGLNFLLDAMQDPNTQVRHTTLWTIGRIFEFVHAPDAETPVITSANLPRVVRVLLESLSDQVHIAEKACYAISQLAVCYKNRETSPMSTYCQEIIQALLNTAERAGASTGSQEAVRLQTQAFEAINEVVRSTATDTLPLISQLVPVVIEKLHRASSTGPLVGDAGERQTELQGLLCGVLQVIIQRLSEPDGSKAVVVGYADETMQCLLAVFACRNASVHEEALLAAGALTYATGPGFAKYMEAFYPVLAMGLANYQEVQVCVASVGVLGDVARAIEEALCPYLDPILHILLGNLKNSEVQRQIKPNILAVFGDIALAVGDRFEPYVPAVLEMLSSAQALSVQQQTSTDEDILEFNCTLRTAIFDAYSGIFNGLSKEKVAALLPHSAQLVVEFMEYVWADQDNLDLTVMQKGVALLGDIAAKVPGAGSLFRSKSYIHPIITYVRSSGDPEVMQHAEWAWEQITKAVGPSNTPSAS